MFLKDLTTEELIAGLGQNGTAITPRMARQIQTLIFKHGQQSLPESAPKDFGHAKWRSVRQAVHVPQLKIIEKTVSPFDGFARYLFAGPDDQGFEAVRIPLLHKPGDEKYIVCASTQVGCGVGCSFCATGKMGFKRNLETWEIVDQIVQIQRDSPHPVRGVVFMGMGEPLLNYAKVINAAKILSAPCATAIDSKAITISTAGVVPAMRRFTKERHKYRLITSLHAATDDLRSHLVPINQNYPLHQIMDALREYQGVTRRRVLLAWTMISGVNMSRDQMRALKQITEGLRFTLDLLPVNDVTGKFQPPGKSEVNAFIDIIRSEVNCPIAVRYSGGKDVHAACGMLAGQHSAEAREERPAPPQLYYPSMSVDGL